MKIKNKMTCKYSNSNDPTCMRNHGPCKYAWACDRITYDLEIIKPVDSGLSLVPEKIELIAGNVNNITDPDDIEEEYFLNGRDD